MGGLMQVGVAEFGTDREGARPHECLVERGLASAVGSSQQVENRQLRHLACLRLPSTISRTRWANDPLMIWPRPQASRWTAPLWSHAPADQRRRRVCAGRMVQSRRVIL